MQPTAWRRIYPAADGRSHLEFARQGDGFATDLDEVTTDFLRWRQSAARAETILSGAAAEVNATATDLAGRRGQEDEADT